ncbi:phosphodiesterase [Paratractidigestivibacter sp.]|uniref:putative bifunctional diguanylate cyclase/phosphodiesterase n=1 Tax=Paratractidigestivibacter sp. TaxID=2847316 RepID=UPI002ABD9829|nr:phosphodiesterase [Paratractidigestivibacter sp.]
MFDWTLISEYLALIFIAVVIYFYYDKRQITTPRRRLFWSCLILTTSSIVLNILTIWVDDMHANVPLPINVAINTLYFVSSVAMTLVITVYLLMREYEFVHDKQGAKMAGYTVAALGAIYAALIATNPWTGWLFHFDASGDYLRGPLNRIVYALPVAEIILIVSCYLLHRKSVSLSMRKIVRCVPIIVALLLIFQRIYPEQLLNGTFAAVIILIIFMNFQSVRIEVDSLTELGNRSSFTAELAARIEAKQDYQVMLVGLRNFSEINRVYGHAGGNIVLFQVARKLEELSRGGFAYRFDGDEFIVLLPHTDAAEQDRRLDRIVSAMRKPWSVDKDHAVRLNAVIVEMRHLGKQWGPENVVNRLEFSLGVAKRENAEVLRFDDQMAERYAKQKRILLSMQTAMQQNRFETWFQPLYCAENGRFETAEALIRMRDEKGRLVSPGDFVPLAEQSDVIDDLTWIVIHGACDLLQSGAIPELRYVSVNLTARQLLQTGVTERLAALLDEHDVDPSQIKLEITERTVTENGALVASVMEEMRGRGFEFMMDDFGTGYSNLSSTVSMPFTYVKLDKSLIDGICSDKNSSLMVSTLIPFFHKVGEKVVAEGIESRDQALAAIDYGADRLQGFHFAKPMPAGELCLWYRTTGRQFKL